MSDRRQSVLNAKRQEMEALQKKNRGGGNGNRVYAFAQNTHRAVGATGEISTYDQFIAMTNGRQTNILFSEDTCEGTMSRLAKDFLSIDPNAKISVSPETFEVSAQLRMPSARIEVADEFIEVPGASLSITASLFKGSDSNDNIYIVDMERKAGDMLAFQKMFKMFKSIFQPLLEDNEEDPLDKDMEMI
jgi:hypothetical protein